MYFADSNILSILLAVITLAAGIYSASSKRKKDDGDIVQQLSQDDNLSFESIFDGLGHQEQDQAQERDVILTKAAEAQAELFDEPVEQPVEQTLEQEKSNDVKSRLKSSPKDAVLFAEILKPKYKEF